MADIDSIIAAAMAKAGGIEVSVQAPLEAPIAPDEVSEEGAEAIIPATVPPAEEPIDEAFSSKFAKLAEREKQFRVMEKKFADQEARINSKLSDLETKEAKFKNPDTLLDMLASAGMSVEEFQRRILMGDINIDKPEVDPIQERFNVLEKELAAQKEFRAQIENQRQVEVANQFVSTYKGQLRDAAARYENLNEYFDSVDEIVDVAVKQADAYAAQYKEAPDVEDVLSQLDAYYGKAVSKFRSKYGQAPAEKQAPKPTAKEPSKTVTNAHTQAASGSVPTINPMDVAKGRVSRDDWINYNLQKIAKQG